MADYIYLLENRLMPAQRDALRLVRELARSKSLTVFLVGGAVRDLTSGSPVRDLDVVVQGDALKLKGDLEQAGAVIVGENQAAQALYTVFPGSVRMEIGSTLSVTWPKPGKPVYQVATILEDLRRRDFTANAMALSLNEGSYGLLMDPLNGIADIENRELRLLSNYGFIEDPVRMIRSARFMARLGWTLDEKTQQRYETGKEENYIAALSDQQRGYELEEIVHEEDPLRIMTRLESEGWLKALAAFWSPSTVDVPALERLREIQTQLQMQGIHPDPSAANFPLLTAKLNAKDAATLKSSFVRQGFVREIESLEQKSKELIGLLTSKSAALPSQTWQILTSASPEAVLWVAYSSKSAAVQAKFKSFFSTWPEARQKIPYSTMQEMRIIPELPIYGELVQKLFFELMDDKLQTAEEIKAFLEPFSPPAPPPPVTTRRPRAAKKDAKGKGRAKKVATPDLDEDLDDSGDGELPDEVEDVLEDASEDLIEDAIETDEADDEAEIEDATPVKSPPSPGARKAQAKTSSPDKELKNSEARIVMTKAASKGASLKASTGENTPAEAVLPKRLPAKEVPTKKSASAKTPALETSRQSSPSRGLPLAKPRETKAPAKLPIKMNAKEATASKGIARKDAVPVATISRKQGSSKISVSAKAPSQQRSTSIKPTAKKAAVKKSR